MNHRIHKRKGLRRLIAASGHQYAGITHALAHDPALRQVGAAVAILILVSVSLPIGAIEHLILIVATGQVLVLEFVNSAIEATVDRISEDHHPLAKVAKDLASVSVGLSALLAITCWLVIVWSLVVS